MANYSDFYIQLTGNVFELRAFYNEFNILTPWHFKISELHDDYFINEPPTLHLTGVSRWGIDMNNIVELASKYRLSGEIIDAESGSDFFIQTTLKNGEIIYFCNTNYLSDEHANWLKDLQYWIDTYSYIYETPEEYPEIVEFLTKHGGLQCKISNLLLKKL